MADEAEKTEGRGAPDEASPKLEWAERWLSKPRLESYLALCGGDVDLALELHEWNVSLGKVLMGDITHFEVALRNAYDRALKEGLPGERHWLFDESSPVVRPIMRKSKAKKLRDVNLMNRKAIAEAQGRAHDPSDPDQVVSGLMLGFWTHMTDRSRERDLWIPCLHRAWPEGTDRAALAASLLSINRVRNRVSHNERLINPSDSALSPKAVDADILRLFRDLCPEAAASLYGDGVKTPVDMLLEESPSPVPVEL